MQASFALEDRTLKIRESGPSLDESHRGISTSVADWRADGRRAAHVAVRDIDHQSKTGCTLDHRHRWANALSVCTPQGWRLHALVPVDARRSKSNYSRHTAGVIHTLDAAPTLSKTSQTSHRGRTLSMARPLSFVTSDLLESFRSRSNRGEVAFEVDPLAACRLSASKIPETLDASSPISTSHTARLTHASERPTSPPLVLSSSRFGIWSTAPAKPARLCALQPPHGDI
ncbi:hypothetical protein PaG_05846 [Moesziomyces aphidis]|uniref:Uncharacterized protein n=1 Tax=Moesziomyces aphidis TaxID=84754 RepID=W3VHN2_MOEAP|nr:hypothetical protein PaG_05846 [Moesziomyces aphidis]